MSAVARLVVGANAGDVFPLDQAPIPKRKKYGGRRKTERSQMLERTLRAMKPGEHFICDCSQSHIYVTAKALGIKVELRSRVPNGFHVWRKS